MIDIFLYMFRSQVHMCPSMAMANQNDEALETQYQKGVKQLYEKGIERIPNKYILPVQERPSSTTQVEAATRENIKLPIIDFAELQSKNRPHVLKSLADACKQYGAFQVEMDLFLQSRSI